MRLAINDDRIALRVADNGRGFEVATAGAQRYGLASMRERAALIDGRFRIDSSPETGTLITLTAPFARPATLVTAEPA